MRNFSSLQNCHFPYIFKLSQAFTKFESYEQFSFRCIPETLEAT